VRVTRQAPPTPDPCHDQRLRRRRSRQRPTTSTRGPVFLAPCLERKPNRTCTYYGSKAKRDIGQFKEYAGPVSVKARNRCIHAAGTITFRGKRHSVVAHPKGRPLYAYHCG